MKSFQNGFFSELRKIAADSFITEHPSVLPGVLGGLGAAGGFGGAYYLTGRTGMDIHPQTRTALSMLPAAAMGAVGASLGRGLVERKRRKELEEAEASARKRQETIERLMMLPMAAGGGLAGAYSAAALTPALGPAAVPVGLGIGGLAARRGYQAWRGYE